MPARRLLALATVAALAAGCLNEVEVTPFSQRTPVLLPSTGALAFTGVTSLPEPAAQVVTVHNGGGGTLAVPVATVTTESGGAWLAAEVTGAQAPYAVTVRATMGALAVGSYAGAVRLESAGARAPRTIPVTFTVRDPIPATIVPSANALVFKGLFGGASPAAQQVTVTNGGDLPLAQPTAAVTYGAGATGWLTATVTGAAPPYTVTLQPTTGSLAAATYTATVRLAAAGAAAVDLGVTFTISAPRNVTVTRKVTPWTEAGAGTPLIDAGVQSVTLKQEDGAGGFTSVTAGLDAPGTWSATIGPGAYWAVIAWTDGTQTWVRSSSAALDLGEDVAGRGDRVQATQVTTATLDLANLLPWDQLGDALVLASYGAQAFGILAGNTTPPLDPGDQADTISAFTFDWAQVAGTLLAAPDQLWLVQTNFLPNGTGTLFYSTTKTWSELTGLTMADGAPAALSAPPADVPSSQASLLLNWRRSQFEAALPPSSSNSPFAHNVAVVALPVPLQSPSPLGAVAVPLLETFNSPTTATDQDVSYGVLGYGRFLPAGWNEAFVAQYHVDVSRTAPGATTPAAKLQDLVSRQDAIAAAPNPVVPLVARPLSPTIGGADLLAAARTGLTTTPTLAWAAPAAGTASAYLVEVYRLTANGAASDMTPVAQFLLTGTSLTIPPGLLQPGQTYLVRLAARSNPADAGGATPFRKGVPYGEASYWTQSFTTAP